MDHSIDNVVSPPKLSLISGTDDELVDKIESAVLGLTGAELDDLMDNHFRHMIDVLNDGIFYMSGNEYVCFYNPSFYSRFGIESGHTDLKSWIDLVHPQDQIAFGEKVDEHIQQDGARVVTQYRIRCTNGRYIWLEGTAVTKTVNGKRFMIGCHRDISDRKLMESYVQQTSLTDGSSGLANEQKLAMDLDNLKVLNEEAHHLMYIQPGVTRSYQSLYAAQMMRNLLSRLTKVLGDFPEQFVDMYRIQSHDFAIIVRGELDESALNKLARRITKVYKEAIRTLDFLFANDISIGIYPNISEDCDTDEVVRVAAQTCQFAAAHSEHSVRIYAGKTKTQIDRHFYIDQELGNAIRNGDLSVKFQPIVCCKSDKVASFESLVRWRSDTLGEIYPDEFISVAEKKGLISELGYFVFEKACCFINKYQRTHTEEIKVNVNVSVLQLLSQQFPDNVKQITKEFGVNANSIVLELTETIILDDNKDAISQLLRLKQFGFQLSLDDFGAGYSSLNSFFDLPLSQIKIDKSIAWRSLENPVTFEYLSFITNLCNAYNIDIVIEGIEDAAMQRVFTDMGAAYLQGYWFSKPLSLASASHYTKI
ncbi:EAL domain-containing protein [Vibrio tubiashii]|uniref:EAL domain-containing protein n=1 Tax=Vibrio tubiashii TaxID=29498 RepID=A0AAE5EW82_9VIBR|nr:EAL domain-containing protein [Vibrio tubiashii]NOI82005.1 EAL domain-containing protein [Vibrio tubiashii]